MPPNSGHNGTQKEEERRTIGNEWKLELESGEREPSYTRRILIKGLLYDVCPKKRRQKRLKSSQVENFK